MGISPQLACLLAEIRSISTPAPSTLTDEGTESCRARLSPSTSAYPRLTDHLTIPQARKVKAKGPGFGLDPGETPIGASSGVRPAAGSRMAPVTDMDKPGTSQQEVRPDVVTTRSPPGPSFKVKAPPKLSKAKRKQGNSSRLTNQRAPAQEAELSSVPASPQESEDEMTADGFTVVKRRKTTVGSNPQVSASNPNPAAPNAQGHQHTKVGKIPPIVADPFPNHVRVMKEMGQCLKGAYQAARYPKRVVIKTTSANDHEAAREVLRRNGILFHTYSLQRPHLVRRVIRGLDADTDPEDIRDGLQVEHGIKPRTVVKLTKTVRADGQDPTRVPMPLFLVIVEKEGEGTPKIDEVVSLYHTRVKVEPYHGREGPAQCYKCLGFHHSSHACERKTTCLRCAGEHIVKDCPKPREEKKCANCQESHIGIYGGCPARLKIIQARQGQSARNSAIRPGVSFAGAVARHESVLAEALTSQTPKPKQSGNATETQASTQAAAAEQSAPKTPRPPKKKKKGGKTKNSSQAGSSNEAGRSEVEGAVVPETEAATAELLVAGEAESMAPALPTPDVAAAQQSAAPVQPAATTAPAAQQMPVQGATLIGGTVSDTDMAEYLALSDWFADLIHRSLPILKSCREKLDNPQIPAFQKHLIMQQTARLLFPNSAS